MHNAIAYTEMLLATEACEYNALLHLLMRLATSLQESSIMRDRRDMLKAGMARGEPQTPHQMDAFLTPNRDGTEAQD